MPDTRSTTPASGAAPEERDGELDRLLNDMQAACYDHSKGHVRGNPLDCAQCQRWVQAVQQLVAQRERAAREAGRAESGEVVGTATLHGHGEDGTTIEAESDDSLPGMLDGDSYRVDLVRRRGKGEG